jgi:hypothetical protein
VSLTPPKKLSEPFFGGIVLVTGNKFIAGVIVTGDNYSPVSLTPVINLSPVSLSTGLNLSTTPAMTKNP